MTGNEGVLTGATSTRRANVSRLVAEQWQLMFTKDLLQAKDDQDATSEET